MVGQWVALTGGQWVALTGMDIKTSNFLPMALDIYQDAVYLVASPMGCLSYNKWGRPNPPYVVFRHSGKTWERVPLQELPLETKTPNLIFSSPDTEVERLGKHFVDAETIRRIASELSQPENRSILREAMPEEQLCPDWNSERYRSPKAPLPMKLPSENNS